LIEKDEIKQKKFAGLKIKATFAIPFSGTEQEDH